MAEIKIYTTLVCPYAHRTRLVLQENAKFATPVPVAA